MKFQLSDLISPQEKREIQIEAKGRVDQQVKDMKKNDKASFSYGGMGDENSRSYEERLRDSYIGTLSEFIAAKITKVKWKKERRQYFTNSRNPDLFVFVNGEKVRCEVRGSRKNIAIYRIRRDNKWAPNVILMAIGNVNKENLDNCEVRYITFGEVKDLVKEHPEWLKGQNTNSPYYEIPIECLHDNFEIFEH